MWIILICTAAVVTASCGSMVAVNGTEQQCRAMMMASAGRVSCVAPDGMVVTRMPR